MNYSTKTGIEIIYGRELGNNLMIMLLAREWKMYLNKKILKPEESLLVVVGRGSSDPDANSNVSKLREWS